MNRANATFRSRYANGLLHYGMIAALCILAIGCSGNRPVQTEVLLNHKNCQTLEAGVTEIVVDQIARIRGSRLLTHPATTTEAATGSETGTQLSSATRVFAVSKGNMPTPGYSFAVNGARLSKHTLTLNLGWQEPAPDAVLPQQISHPCLVVALPVADAQTLVVQDAGGELGRVAL